MGKSVSTFDVGYQHQGQRNERQTGHTMLEEWITPVHWFQEVSVEGHVQGDSSKVREGKKVSLEIPVQGLTVVRDFVIWVRNHM